MGRIQLDFFMEPNQEALREVKALEIETMTPLEAMLYLAKLKKRIL